VWLGFGRPAWLVCRPNRINTNRINTVFLIKCS
jgi:hypothetical protein